MFPPPSEAPGPTDCGETSGSLGGLARAQSCAPYRGAPGRRDPLPATWGHEAPASGGQRRSRLASAVNAGSDAPTVPGARFPRRGTVTAVPSCFPSPRRRLGQPDHARPVQASLLPPLSAARQVPSQAGVPRTRGLLWSCHPLLRHWPTSPARPGQKLGAQNWDGSSRGPLGICPPPHSPAGPPEGQWPCEGRAHGAGLARTEDTSDPADLQSHD